MRDMADTKLVGQNYTTPDLVAKVTGKAKYAEDYRVEGMLFAKLLASPMPRTPTPPPESRGGAGGAGAGAAGAGAGQAAEGRRGAGGEGRAGRGGRGAGAAAPAPPQLAVWKWTEDDFKNAGDHQLPLGKFT